MNEMEPTTNRSRCLTTLCVFGLILWFDTKTVLRVMQNGTSSEQHLSSRSNNGSASETMQEHGTMVGARRLAVSLRINHEDDCPR